MLVALGPSAAMIGVVSSVGLAIATALNAAPTGALEDAAAALAGGLGAAAIAFAFHRRGQRAEAAALAAAYRVLGDYAHGIGRGGAALPDGTAFDAVAATLALPGPHRTRGLAVRDRALADRAERLRTVLAALAVTRDRLARRPADGPVSGPTGGPVSGPTGGPAGGHRRAHRRPRRRRRRRRLVLRHRPRPDRAGAGGRPAARRPPGAGAGRRRDARRHGRPA